MEEKYSGEVCGDMKHGRGKLVYPNGCVYEGEFKNNKRHGYGIFKNQKGVEIY